MRCIQRVRQRSRPCPNRSVTASQAIPSPPDGGSYFTRRGGTPGTRRSGRENPEGQAQSPQPADYGASPLLGRRDRPPVQPPPRRPVAGELDDGRSSESGVVV